MTEPLYRRLMRGLSVSATVTTRTAARPPTQLLASFQLPALSRAEYVTRYRPAVLLSTRLTVVTCRLPSRLSTHVAPGSTNGKPASTVMLVSPCTSHTGQMESRTSTVRTKRFAVTPD